MGQKSEKASQGGRLEQNVVGEGEQDKFVRQRVWEGVFQAKGTVVKRKIRNWQPLGMTKKFFFSSPGDIAKSQIMKGLMATMFGFYCDVVLGKYLKDFFAGE